MPTDVPLRFGEIPTFTEAVYVDNVFHRFAAHWPVLITGIADRENTKDIVGFWDSQELPKFLLMG